MVRLQALGSLLFLLCPLVVHAELRVAALPAPDPATAEAFKVPMITGAPTDVAERINLWLQYKQLEVIPGHYSRSPFENVGGNSGTTGLGFDVAAQTSNLLSLKLNGEYMGAYPSAGQSAVNFDLASGRPIVIEDLLTPAGLSRFSKRVAAQRLKTIDAFISTLSTSQSTDGRDADERDSQRTQYLECRSNNIADGAPSGDLLLAKDHLSTASDCYFPHVIQALDDIGEMKHSETYAALARDLSPYGLCLLLAQRRDCQLPMDTLHAGVYRGSLGGRFPVTLLVIAAADKTADALYFYDRIGAPISLVSTMPGPRRVRLEVKADSRNPASEVFDLVVQRDGSLEGAWTQTGKAPLSVTLH